MWSLGKVASPSGRTPGGDGAGPQSVGSVMATAMLGQNKALRTDRELFKDIGVLILQFHNAHFTLLFFFYFLCVL